MKHEKAFMFHVSCCFQHKPTVHVHPFLTKKMVPAFNIILFLNYLKHVFAENFISVINLMHSTCQIRNIKRRENRTSFALLCGLTRNLRQCKEKHFFNEK